MVFDRPADLEHAAAQPVQRVVRGHQIRISGRRPNAPTATTHPRRWSRWPCWPAAASTSACRPEPL